MDVSALRQKILDRDIPRFMVFTGVEWMVQRIYIKEIGKVVSEPIYADFKTVYSQIRNSSLLQSDTRFYVLIDDQDLLTSDKAQEFVSSDLRDYVVLVLTDGVDRRTAFYKRFADLVIEFKSLPDSVLKKYVQKQLPLGDGVCDELIRVCEHDYGRLLLEIDKVKHYARGVAVNKSDINYDCYVRRLLNAGIIYAPPYDAVFDFVDAVLDRNVARSFELLDTAYKFGESTFVLLSVLYNNARAVLQIQSYGGKDAESASGLTAWQVRNAQKHVGAYSIHELVNMLKYICQCEQDIKSGRIDEKMVMERILVHVV